MKKLLSALTAAAVLIMSMCTVLPANAQEAGSALNEPFYIMGDVNGGGDVTSSDALIILRVAVGERKLTNEEISIADTNGDGRVTSADALQVLRYAVGNSTGTSRGLRASELKDLSAAEVIEKVGPLFTENQRSSGVLASVSLAQFILESGYGKSDLAQSANNCFGMKTSLSGNTWAGSAWDGVSVYTKQTMEENPDGSTVIITADFRKYACVEDSIADHSAYLTGAKNGDKLRYDGIVGNTNYRAVIQLIKDGGYATSSSYVDSLCSIIERWDLTRFDC